MVKYGQMELEGKDDMSTKKVNVKLSYTKLTDKRC